MVVDDSEPELRRYLRVLIERRWIIAASLLVGAALFAVWALREHKVYEATASLIVDRTPPQVLGGDVHQVVDVGPGQYYALQDYIQTMRRVLVSDGIARKLIKRLDLMSDRDFWDGDPPSTEEKAVAEVVRSITVKTVADTQIITVAFMHGRPEQAKRAVDGLLDTFIEANAESRDDVNASASHWLAEQADDLKERLAISELALFEFKRQNDLLSFAIDDRENTVSQQISKLTDALTDSRLRKMSRATERDELKAISEAGPGTALPPPMSNSSQGDTKDALESLKEQRYEEERKLSELRARYEDSHPMVVQQLAKIGSVNEAIKEEMKAMVRGADSRVTEAGQEEKKIAEELDLVKKEGMRVTRLEIEYNTIKRETDALAKQYAMVQGRGKETELSSKIKESNLHVLDYARLPSMAVSPRLFSGFVARMVLALLFGVLCAFGLDALDRTIKSQEDVEQKVAVPFLGIIPRIAANEVSDTAVADNPSSVTAEFCRLIRTNLLFADVSRPLRRLMVTSSTAREGKTLTTISLGVVLAQSGAKILLVDCDLRRPRLKSALGLPGNLGITDVVLGNATLEQAIQPTKVPNLFVLASGPVPPNPAELIDAPRFQEVLDLCSAGYDRVLLDTAPAVPVTDPALLSRYCDGVVLVLRKGRTSIDHARRARRSLTDVGATILGAVLNDVELTRSGFGYGYGYSYGYGYGYGYGYSQNTTKNGEGKRRKKKKGGEEPPAEVS